MPICYVRRRYEAVIGSEWIVEWRDSYGEWWYDSESTTGSRATNKNQLISRWCSQFSKKEGEKYSFSWETTWPFRPVNWIIAWWQLCNVFILMTTTMLKRVTVEPILNYLVHWLQSYFNTHWPRPEPVKVDLSMCCSVWNVWNTQESLARCSIVDIDSKETPAVIIMFHRSSGQVWRRRGD